MSVEVRLRKNLPGIGSVGDVRRVSKERAREWVMSLLADYVTPPVLKIPEKAVSQKLKKTEKRSN